MCFSTFVGAAVAASFLFRSDGIPAAGARVEAGGAQREFRCRRAAGRGQGVAHLRRSRRGAARRRALSVRGP
ncbi:hypothetical protein C9I56_34295 [Paraburkholderia caribensis]|nr:hypothetical protein ATN79_08780 [Paraburkholderia caribensis]PTB24384.1 hypothetical protein C9I56_34295 [Paraburkholderia caribensis]